MSLEATLLGALASLPSAYLEANLLVALVCLAAVPLLRAAARRTGLLPRRQLVRLARVGLLAAILAPLVVAVLPRHRLFAAADDFWMRSEAPTASPPTTDRHSVPAVKPAPTAPPAAAETPLLPLAVWTLLGVALVLRAAHALRDVVRLRRIVRSACPWRRNGRLRVLVASDVATPLSFRTLRTAYVLLPAHLAADADALRIALRHEGQHHRHGDTAWLALAEGLALFLPLNPVLGAFRRALADLQEFACDEALVGQQRCGAHAYGSCLIRVTEAAQACRATFAGTASMASAGRGPEHSQHLLERRIAMLSRYPVVSKPRRLARLASWASAAVAVAVFACAYAAKGAKAHAPLTLEEARKLAAAMDPGPDFPLTVNERVLARLNRYITDPRRNADARDALARMQKLKPMIVADLERYDLPQELLAIPLVESGYENLPQATWQTRVNVPPEYTGAGLWMFIKSTARAYGLVVTDQTDQRLDLQLETDAAMRLLAADRLRFKDWLLALAAYNEGEGAVQKAIDTGGTRDAWALVEQGKLNDYLAAVTAAWIMMGNPQILD